MKRALLVLVLPAIAWAQAVRYNDPPPPSSRAPLVAHIDELAARLAKKGRRLAPRPDARLDAAATDIARLVGADETPPNELVQGALWVHGIVEPSPNFILATMGKDGEAELLRALGGDLARVLAEGRYARIGVGLAPADPGDTRVLVALQESFVDLDPIARAQPLGGNVLVRGQLHEGFVRPEAFVTEPSGRVLSRVLIGSDPVRFGGKFRCGPDPGRYQIEVTGEDRFGATVVANFPVWCGVAPPMTPQAAAPARTGKNEPFTTAAAAERSVWKLLNADRARAGLPPLAWDDKLADVARSHSEDMLAHHFFGHVSPTTGNAGDRVRKARIDTMLVLENVARAFSTTEAERGLMNSPGHRANILNREATRVGVGVVLDPSDKEILVTQLFARPPEAFDAHTVDELRRGIVELRRARKLPPLERDPWLDELARTTAVEEVRHAMSSAQAGKRVDAALQEQSQRWRAGHAIFAVTAAVSQLIDSIGAALADREATHVGVGIEPGPRKDGGSGLYVVIVLATRR